MTSYIISKVTKRKRTYRFWPFQSKFIYSVAHSNLIITCYTCAGFIFFVKLFAAPYLCSFCMTTSMDLVVSCLLIDINISQNCTARPMDLLVIKPRHLKTCFMSMQTKRRRSACATTQPGEHIRRSLTW